MVSFFCKKCRLDQDLPSRKNGNRFVSWEEAACVQCDTRLIRYITEKHLDPYYRESIRVQKEQDEHAKDLVQPNESKFKYHYKDSWNKMEEAAEKQEQKQKEEERKKDDFYKKWKYNTTEKNAAKKILDGGY